MLHQADLAPTTDLVNHHTTALDLRIMDLRLLLLPDSHIQDIREDQVDLEVAQEDHAHFVAKTLSPALETLEKLTEIEPESLRKWPEKWLLETLSGLSEVRNSASPADAWAEKVAQWSENRASEWAELVLHDAVVAGRRAA